MIVDNLFNDIGRSLFHFFKNNLYILSNNAYRKKLYTSKEKDRKKYNELIKNEND